MMVATVGEGKPSKRRRYVDEVVQAADAARELGVSREQISVMIENGRLFAYKIGKSVLVPKDEIERVRGLPPRKVGRPRTSG